MPRFSIIVPAFNASATLAETLDAILAQGSPDWECIVVDDGSTDSTAEIATVYCERDSRFVLVRQKNQGASGAHRSAVAASTGQYVVLCSADDYLLPEHLEVMTGIIDAHPSADIVSCNGYLLAHETGECALRYDSPEWQQPRSLSMKELIAECFFSTGAAYSRRLSDRIGDFRPGVYVDDYDFWLRAFAHGAEHMYTPHVISVHRVSQFQQSANIVEMHKSIIDTYKNLQYQQLVEPELMPLVRSSIRRRQLAMYAAKVSAYTLAHPGLRRLLRPLIDGVRPLLRRMTSID